MAVLFDAAADRLSRTTNLPPSTSFTIMAWTYLTLNSGTYGTLFALGQTGGTAYYMGTRNDGVTFYISQGAFFLGSVLSLQTWYHCAFVVAGTGAGQCLGYLNGALNVTYTDSAVAITMASVDVGNDQWPDPWPGRVANVLVYNVPLTQAEIAQQMRQYVPLRWAGLNAWYPLLGSGNLRDYASTANAWTVGGTLTSVDGPPIAWETRPRPRAVWAVAAVVRPRPPTVQLRAVPTGVL
jgi:Concanavalin A-like lectin/glucanases superfamily